jgi:hypothetical protein
MMRNERNAARTGHKGCKCCYPLPDNATLRKREKLMWWQDNDDSEDWGVMEGDDVEGGNA